MICDYGCNQPAMFVFDKGKRKKQCCSDHYRKCPHQKEIVGMRRKGSTHSDETKKLLSSRLKGKKSWAKGYTKDTHPGLAKLSDALTGLKRSEESCQRIRESKIGSIPWNKGKTSEEDHRILSGSDNGMFGKTHTETVKQMTRDRNAGKWAGENNPWFGKDRSFEKSPRWKGNTHKSEYKKYYHTVSRLTEQNYLLNLDTINPNGYIRGKAGIADAYHLDHVFPVIAGFELGLPIEVLADVRNLQLLPWYANSSKQASIISRIEIEEIAKDYDCVINWELLKREI